MKIIDFRLRVPAFKGYKKNLYEQYSWFPGMFGMAFSEAANQFSMDLLIKEMDEVGIDKAVVPVRSVIGCTNEELLEVLAKYPDRFIGMAGIDHTIGEKAALEVIDKYVVNGPCVGVTMEPGMTKSPVKANDKILYPIYEKCQDANAIMFLSFGGLVGPNMNYNDPSLCEEAAAAFPNLKFVLAHACYPYVNEACFLVFKMPNVYLLPDFYMVAGACVPGAKDYVSGANWLKNKFIFGSAFPLMPLKGAVEAYRSLDLAPDVLENVMYNNAAALLGIK